MGHKWKLRNFTQESLQKLADESTSISNMLSKIGLTGGSSHNSLKGLLKTLQIRTSHFTGSTWNKGLTKSNHPSIARAAIMFSKTRIGLSGHPQTLETREKQSIARIHYLETHHNHGLKWFAITQNNGTEIKVQGNWEKKVAEWLNENNVRWLRPTLKFKSHRRFTPDFYLPDYDFYIEVKGFWRERDKYKLFLVLDEHRIDLRIIDHSNIDQITLDLPRFVDRFKREEINENCFKNIWSNDVTAAM